MWTICQIIKYLIFSFALSLNNETESLFYIWSRFNSMLYTTVKRVFPNYQDAYISLSKLNKAVENECSFAFCRRQLLASDICIDRTVSICLWSVAWHNKTISLNPSNKKKAFQSTRFLPLSIMTNERIIWWPGKTMKDGSADMDAIWNCGDKLQKSHKVDRLLPLVKSSMHHKLKRKTLHESSSRISCTMVANGELRLSPNQQILRSKNYAR